MNDTLETEEMPLDLRLAAIVTLLSASALRGPTTAKTAALRTHLFTALADETLTPQLRDALEQSLADWLVFYNTQRPHHRFKQQSPLQSLLQHHPECQRYWTHTGDCKTLKRWVEYRVC